jgi:hypothetical protein
MDTALKAFELIRAGSTVPQAAAALGVNENTLYTRLNNLQEYRAWRKAQAEARQVKTYICPVCGETMQKQPLYFWMCKCGGEFWPPEDQIPDNPDLWNVPETALDAQDAAGIIRRMLQEGEGPTKIAQALNEAGHLTPRGKPWTPTNVQAYTKQHGLAARNWAKDRARVEEIILSMAGRNATEMAERLNLEGIKPLRGDTWQPSAVHRICKKLGVKLEYGSQGLLPTKKKTGKGKGGRNHPWSKAEHARIQLNRRRYGK